MTASTPAGAGPNAAQQEYWNTVAGPRWVGFGRGWEARNAEASALLLARGAPAAGESILEIGCGTGALTLPLAAAVGERGRVLGIDISEPMLAVARRRVAEAGLGNVSLVLADAQVHPFEPASVDLITSRFGVMFFADPAAAFANIGRAAKPGGRLVFAAWAPVAENPHWRVAYDPIVARLGPPAPKPPHEPGPLAFSDPDYVRGFLTAAGFAAIEVARERVEVVGATPEEETDRALVMGPSGRLLDEKQPDPATREALRQEIAAAYRRHVEDGRLRLPATIFLVTARRP